MKALKMILFTLIIASSLVASVTLAQPPMGEETGAGGAKSMRPKRHGPLGQLMQFQHQNITVAVLAELTGLDAHIIAAEIEFSHPSEILSNYDIELETFIAAMDLQMTALVEAAVASETITADQRDEIITMIKNKPERPETGQQEEGEIPPRFEYTE